LTFKTDGNRVWLLVEPATYANGLPNWSAEKLKSDSLPLLRMHHAHHLKQDRVFIPNEPKMLYSSFTILQAQGDNFSYIFYPSPDVYMAIKTFYR
jgi:hypothetical protein